MGAVMRQLNGYSPSNVRHDGSFRRIRVKVRGHNYVVRTRTGYYDRADERVPQVGALAPP